MNQCPRIELLPSIAAIILNWNDSSATIRCCESLLQAFDADGKRDSSYACYLVDNGSDAKHFSTLQDWCETQNRDTIKLIANRANLGYASGMNAGIYHALEVNPDYIWLLNNDT